MRNGTETTEVRRILQQNQKVFRLFIGGVLLVGLLVLLAMFWR